MIIVIGIAVVVLVTGIGAMIMCWIAERKAMPFDFQLGGGI